MAKQKDQRLTKYAADIIRTDTRTKAVVKIVTVIVKYGGPVICAYSAHLVLLEWSGKTTIAKLDFTGILGLPGNTPLLMMMLLLIMFTAGSLYYGRYQGKLRRDTVRHLESHIKYLEKVLDPDRSSSGLTLSGQTPEEDS